MLVRLLPLLATSVVGIRALGKAVLWSLVSLVAVAPTVTMEPAAVNVLFVPLLGGRLVRSGVIYWSQCVEGLIVMGVVYIGC